MQLKIDHPEFAAFFSYLAFDACFDMQEAAKIIEQPWKWTREFSLWKNKRLVSELFEGDDEIIFNRFGTNVVAWNDVDITLPNNYRIDNTTTPASIEGKWFVDTESLDIWEN